MIGADDFASFFDPDEFGCTAHIVEAGGVRRPVDGIVGAPAARGGVYRAGIDPGAAQVRAAPNQVQLQIPASETPRPWMGVKVIIDQVTYSIADVSPLGRLRSLLTLTPDGKSAGSAQEQSKWRLSS